MGGKSSREEGARYRHSSPFHSTSSFSGNQFDCCSPQPSYSFARDQNYPAYGSQPYTPQKKLDKRYSTIADDYTSLEQVVNIIWFILVARLPASLL